jgi:NADPH:quinone reductase-like Zn-dependent oxidoreductase
MGSRAEYAAIVAHAHAGQLWPRVDSVVPLEQAVTAFERLESGAHVGKVVVQVAS